MGNEKVAMKVVEAVDWTAEMKAILKVVRMVVE